MRALNIIVCVDNRGGFAKEGKIPWHFSKDLKRFREITEGHYCIMGRRTYEEIVEIKHKKSHQAILSPSEPILPGRESIVLSRNPDYAPAGAVACKSLAWALDYHCPDTTKQIFILGGDKLFIQAICETKYVYQTIIDHNYNCDRFFLINYLNTKFKIVEGKETTEKKKTLYFTKWERVVR
jgi:dihydrofolate reductase